MEKNKPQKRYRKANIKSKIVDFGKNDTEIYEYSKTINFTKFVKVKLREDLENGSKHL